MAYVKPADISYQWH